MHQTLQQNSRKIKKNIVLVGVAGVGKTTLGEIAAEKLNMAFVDISRLKIIIPTKLRSDSGSII